MDTIELIKARIEKQKEYYQDLRIESDNINGIIEGLEFALNVIDTIDC